MDSTPADGSSPGQPSEIVLARWSTRFWAWLIDFIIVNVVLGAIFTAATLPFWLADPGSWSGKPGGRLATG